ncbi:MAG: phosphotransferase family protein [Acidimicrobiia bacterium]
MSDTAPIRPEERFDELRVASYLQAAVPELFSGAIVFDQFPGGAANLTYRATVDDGREFVLRRAPLGEVARSGHDMAREYRVLSRLWAEFPLAPRAYHFCEDPDIMGKPFFVMERRRGVVVRKRWPPEYAESPALRRSVGEALVDALVDLHAVEPSSVDLETLGRPVGFVERQIDGWTRRWERAATRPVPDMDRVAELLSEGTLPPASAVILHNDYKLDNTMVDDAGGLVAVFDWDMATIGDPLVDVGTLLAYWAQPDDPTYAVFGEEAVAIGEAMPKHEVRMRYAERSGRDLADVSYYEALALFRIAVIIEQIYARYVSGQTTDARFAAFEPIAPLLAGAARQLLEE